jgi:hypothetical protein
MRRCTKLGCDQPAAATVGLRYAERILWLRELAPERDPNFLELCGAHADRLTAPVGWTRLDERLGARAASPAEEPTHEEVALLEAAVAGRLVWPSPHHADGQPFLGTLVHKMGLDRDLIQRVRGLDQYDLRRLLIFARGLLVSREGGDPAAEAPPPRGKVTFRQERVRCGRPSCTRCPHGPYWYAYWREGRRLRSRYIGKDLPAVPGGQPPTAGG